MVKHAQVICTYTVNLIYKSQVHHLRISYFASSLLVKLLIFFFQRLKSLFVTPLVLGIKFVRIILEPLIVFVQMVSMVKITAQVYLTS